MSRMKRGAIVLGIFAVLAVLGLVLYACGMNGGNVPGTQNPTTSSATWPDGGTLLPPDSEGLPNQGMPNEGMPPPGRGKRNRNRDRQRNRTRRRNPGGGSFQRDPPGRAGPRCQNLYGPDPPPCA